MHHCTCRRCAFLGECDRKIDDVISKFHAYTTNTTRILRGTAPGPRVRVVTDYLVTEFRERRPSSPAEQKRQKIYRKQNKNPVR